MTLRDVARTLKVSVATVSNAYNRPDQLSAELRTRILDTAHELGYHGPDPVARSLRRGRTGVIGVVYDAPLEYAFADPAAALFLGSVAHALQQDDLNLLLLACPHDPTPVRTASVDGLIVYCAAPGSELLEAVLQRTLPTVLMDQDPHPQAVQIGIDDAGGARQAAQHLTALGHQHLGVISLEFGPARPGGLVSGGLGSGGVGSGELGSGTQGSGPSYRTTAERLRAYREAALDAGDIDLYVMETAQNTPQEAERRTLELLSLHPQISALLCMSDVLAQGAMRAAQALGRRIPEQLSVIGYDDLPGSAALNLTTVWQPTSDKGQQVGEAVLALLRGEQPQDMTLPTRLVVRGSTAPPAIQPD